MFHRSGFFGRCGLFVLCGFSTPRFPRLFSLPNSISVFSISQLLNCLTYISFFLHEGASRHHFFPLSFFCIFAGCFECAYFGPCVYVCPYQSRWFWVRRIRGFHFCWSW